MRSVSMCFSVLQTPRYKIRYLMKGNAILPPKSLTSICSGNFNGLESRRNFCVKPHGVNTGKNSREISSRIGRTLNSGDNKIQKSKSCTVSPVDLYPRAVTEGTKLIVDKSNVSKSEVLDEVIVAGSKSNVNKLKVGEFEDIKSCDVEQNTKCTDVQPLVTIIVFDFETTGLNRGKDRIVEIALQDIKGGENSTFVTLVNPERYVANANIHGITNEMVRRPNVPRFKDLIPILRYYVKSRQVPGCPVLWVAHNARVFDVPFLMNEFSRCSEEIPSDWLFLDTLCLARELAKLEEMKGLSGKSLKALGEYFNIPLEGKAHRAMADVLLLSKVLREMTFALKLPVSALVERSFKVSDLVNLKKNTN